MHRRFLLTIFAVLIVSFEVAAQQVPRKVVVEHFTNTYCSICANRNPGFYNAISQFPDILHVAYHPSAPYPSCPINQYNKSENDDRANYYGIYGATPRIVIQGNVINATQNYGDNTLYQNEQNKMSSFAVRTTLTKTSATSIDVTVVIKKMDTSSIASLTLYGLIAEDTLQFNANNGETEHYDVFRKSIWGAPQSITVPVNVGDSISMSQTITIDNIWNSKRTYALAFIQDGNKNVIQAERSETVDSPSDISIPVISNSIHIVPNPANNIITISGTADNAVADVYNLQGQLVIKENLQHNNTIDISRLTRGQYIIKLYNDNNHKILKLIKN